MLAASFVAFLSSNQFATLKLAFNFWDPFAISQYRLSRLSADEYKTAIEKAIEEGDISEAQTLVEIALENGHELPAELVNRTQENTFEYGLRYTLDFINGVRTGEITNASSIGGVLFSDYIGVGDLRDVIIHGYPAVMGEDYDKITLGLSLIGLTTSATIIASAGGTIVTGGAAVVVTGPAIAAASTVDSGASLIKNANKIRKLSQPLVENIYRISAKAIDLNGLKKGLSNVSMPTFNMPSMSAIRTAFGEVNWSNVLKGDYTQLKKPFSEMIPNVDIKGAAEALSSAIRKEAIDEIGILANSASGIVSAGGAKTAFRAMEHADDIKELSRFQKLSVRMGEKTAVVIKVLGKGAIKLGKLLYLVISVLMAVLGWLIGALWFLYSIIHITYRAAKRAKAAI